MPQAKEGDTVRVHYTGSLKDGTVFDSSDGRDPLEFTIGENQIIPGFEKAVVGLEEGQSTNITVAPEAAYGDHREDLVISTPRSNVPENIDPEVGMMLQVRSPDGSTSDVRITEVGEETITLDGNHPLAGKELAFEIELVEIAA